MFYYAPFMAIYTLGTCLAGLALYFVVPHVWRSPPLPPGPPGLPLIGNLLDVRGTGALYKTVGGMASKYGPIIHLKVLGKRFVFLNSFKATKDLLDKQSAITSDRPHLIVAGDLIGWGNITPLLRYGDIHRKHRKFFSQHMRSSTLVTLYPAQEAEARRFILNILKSPDDLIGHCHRATESFIFKISHGYTVKSDDDPLVEIAHRAMRNISETTAPGRFLADFLPILKHLPEWLPGGGFHRDVRQGRKVLSDALNTPFEFVLRNLSEAASSFIGRALQEGATSEDEEVLKWISFGMYIAGSETTPSMLSAFFLAMTMYPEVLKKAQAEVDAVVGNDRLPNMQDLDALPYVNAICTELLRWNVVVPLPAHLSTQDIIYEGYSIPKGSLLMPNVWFILSNPETYPNPEIFNPERFLGEHRQPDPREACFGWGGRRCLGARLAESLVFICTVTALATLDLSRCIESGVECVPKYEFEEGMLRHVKPFKCKIVLRSNKAVNLLQDGSK